MEPIKIFISYSHDDFKYMKNIRKSLAGRVQTKEIQVWTDEEIIAGEDYDPDIKKALEDADIILFLISINFIASWYIGNVELNKAVDRHKQGLVKLIPVHLEDCDYKSLSLSSKEPLPMHNKRLKPINKWKPRSEGYDAVVKGINIAIADLRNNKQSASPTSIKPADNSGGQEITRLNLPPKAYDQLIGRESEINKIMEALGESKSKPAVLICGLGGIGKTALSREVVEHCRQNNSFKHIVWASFKTEQFIDGKIFRIDNPKYSFNELLSDISDQCGGVIHSDQQRRTMETPATEDRLWSVRRLLNEKRVLIVLDNLETIPDGEELIVKILEIIGTSKLFITSRHQVRNDRLHNIPLKGIAKDAGVTFLREEGKARGFKNVANADRSTLLEIHKETGGAPLAMKLVVGQMSRQPKEIVLHLLKKASVQGSGYTLYRFLFRNDWQMLDMNARMILVDMSVFPPLIGGAVKDVETISQVKGPEFWKAMDLLVGFSLVDKTGLPGRERFYLHQLTWNFIRSDITKEDAWIQE